MTSLTVVGISLIIAATVIEFIFVIFPTDDKKLIKDARSNILLGVIYFLTDLLIRSLAFGVFSLCYYYSIFKPELSWQLWVVGFLACDFVHYIYHWLGHRTRIFWAPHVTHHSSEYFNMSHGYRINVFQTLYRFLFWAPLCFLGIPPVIVLFVDFITAMQNFFVHTEKVRKLGPLDWIFNTPSNHRVHHGTNPQYLDKNLGGVLMIFDHLFGTYAKEVDPPVYGIVHQINTNDPYKITTHEYIRVIKETSKIKGVLNKLRYLFSPPD
jgi:sterol desaturase/sphingolipid hydroxylase (fatty acid hydroxylase superfamily)